MSTTTTALALPPPRETLRWPHVQLSRKFMSDGAERWQSYHREIVLAIRYERTLLPSEQDANRRLELNQKLSFASSAVCYFESNSRSRRATA